MVNMKPQKFTLAICMTVSHCLFLYSILLPGNIILMDLSHQPF